MDKLQFGGLWIAVTNNLTLTWAYFSTQLQTFKKRSSKTRITIAMLHIDLTNKLFHP